MTSQDYTFPSLRVVIDGEHEAKLSLGYFGSWSERLLLEFTTEHPVYKEGFMTKWYEFETNNQLRLIRGEATLCVDCIGPWEE